MTSRERVRAVLAHEIPDRIPNGLGGCETEGLHIVAYDNLQKILGVERKPPRLDTFMTNAVFEEPVIRAMEGDILLLASLNMCPSEIRGRDIADQWKEQELWGRTFSVPVREKFTLREDGVTVWETAGGAICPKGCYFFDHKGYTDLQPLPAFPRDANAQPDAALDAAARQEAEIIAPAGANIFTGSQSAANMSPVDDITFGDLRSFLMNVNSDSDNDSTELAAAAAPFKVSEPGVYFIKLDLGDLSGLIGKRLNYYAAPFNNINNANAASPARVKSKLRVAAADNITQGKLLDANGNEIDIYQGGDINALVYIESAGLAYGQFITADTAAADSEEDEAASASDSNSEIEDNSESNSETASNSNSTSSNSSSRSGCNAQGLHGSTLLMLAAMLSLSLKIKRH